jgi:transposase
MTMVEFLKMIDKQGQQRRRRMNGAVWSVADRKAVEKDRPVVSKPPKQRKGGRPWMANRRVLEGILWILRSGARWQDLPEKFPHPSTCWRRLRDWEERGVWLNIWRTFLSELNERQQLKWSESFLDGSFAPAKKGAAESEKPSGARGRSGWWWSTAAVFLWETTFTLPPRRKSGAWLGNFRRLVVRYDRWLTIYGAFFHIACFMIVLRRVVQ